MLSKEISHERQNFNINVYGDISDLLVLDYCHTGIVSGSAKNESSAGSECSQNSESGNKERISKLENFHLY